MNVSQAVEQYVAMKRVMGVSFKWGTEVLHAFSRHVGDISLDAVAKGQVLAFLDKSASSDRAWLSRYRSLKAFFDYWIARNELATLPLPPPRRPAIARNAIPYIYSVSELRQLLKTASVRRRATPRDFSSLTFRTLLLFLYATGARMNETMSLTQQDIDLTKATVTFHRPPPAVGRTIPIGPHLCRALREYADTFDCRDDRKAFFTRRDGKSVRAIDLTVSFQKLRRQAGIARLTVTPRQPQIRDLRRTFAVHCMRRWLQEGKDLRSMLPLLGAYLGHVSLASTEAYLAVTPERFRVQLSRLGSAQTRPSLAEHGTVFTP
jgi:integrase/recombinase XerD